MVTDGAYAEVILVDGNPLEDITMVRPDRVRLVMKGGTVYKDTLDRI